MKVKFFKASKDAKVPLKGTEESACFDMIAISVNIDKENKLVTYDTGIIVEIPKGYCLECFMRSSVKRTSLLLSNGVGIIDSDYRGTIKAVFRVLNDNFEDIYQVGERIIQVKLEKLDNTEFEEVKNLDELSKTKRGNGGYGSTGK